MTPATKPLAVPPETHLQRALTAALNELEVDAAFAGTFPLEQGPLVPQVCRGFTPRDIQAIVRTLSTLPFQPAPLDEAEGGRAMRLRLITPGARNLLAIPLRYRNRVYGYMALGRKESGAFSKKDRAAFENAADEITKTLDRESLFDQQVVLSRPLVAAEPLPVAAKPADLFASPPSHATPELEAQIHAVLDEARSLLPFDRAWVCYYDPLAGSVEALGIAGDLKGEQKKDLKPGQRLALDSSAAGWAVRHRKPRVDLDLASTQGRFLDHKHLYKDRFHSSIVLPFFVHGQVGGTVTLASKEPSRYVVTDARTLEPVTLKLVELLQQAAAPSKAGETGGGAVPLPRPESSPSEPAIRKQERQAALGEFSAFLASEVREPLASIRAQLEEVTGEGILDFDPQTRIENAMRDLMRIEALLNEILDFAKPLELNRRLCRVPEIIENALNVIATDLEVSRIQVTKNYPSQINPVRCDEAKMQQVLLSIFRNAVEAMSPGGQLRIELSHQRGARHREVQILIHNNGAPIPAEIVDKVFEPFFTTKRTGTGLGLATVKKIVVDHQGSISIASAPEQGTTVIIRLPAISRGPAYRHRHRGRRPPHRRTH